MPRKCAFCGKDEVTKEHLFAKWIRNAFAEYAPEHSTIALEIGGSIAWQYGGNTLEQNVKAFCATCNNNWMSALEARAGRIMQPMLKAERVGIKLGYAEQLHIASWATKTAMVLHQLHPADNFIPESDYRDFRRKVQPSSNVFVVIGARHTAGTGKRTNLFEYKERFIGDIGANPIGIAHVHYALGALYLGVAMFVGKPRRYPRAIHVPAAERALQVWPVQPRTFTWPSPSISEIGGVQGMFDAFAGASWG